MNREDSEADTLLAFVSMGGNIEGEGRVDLARLKKVIPLFLPHSVAHVPPRLQFYNPTFRFLRRHARTLASRSTSTTSSKTSMWTEMATSGSASSRPS